MLARGLRNRLVGRGVFQQPVADLWLVELTHALRLPAPWSWFVQQSRCARAVLLNPRVNPGFSCHDGVVSQERFCKKTH